MKKFETSHIEILAPAGSFETLQTAIDAGADSVYFGIADFNMRATAAANFKREDLDEIVARCKKEGVKTYITLNTVLYNEELEKMHSIVNKVKEVGVDAVIAADMATVLYAREKDVEVHISTQISISNTETVKYFSQFTDRIVLARELSLEQVTEIVDDIKEQDIRGPRGDLIEIEVFAHGAMCVAVSGRCAMSLYCNNTSANRGKCSQMCRRPYKVTDKSSGKELVVDNNYVMSAADMSTLGMLPELIASGIKVLKFEGRGRSAEYVDTVISTYKDALKAIENGTYNDEKVLEWNERLGTVFNRGQSTGFYMRKPLTEWAGTHGSKASKERTFLGVVEHYYPQVGVAEIKIQAKENLLKGEDFIITGGKTGLVKGNNKEMRKDEDVITKAEQGDIITMKVDKKVRKNDKFYVIRDRESLIPRGKEQLISGQQGS